MLAKHVERAGPARLAVEVAGADRVERGAAFQHLEAVRRHQHRARRRVVAVVGAADALHQPLDVLRRADLDHQIDVAPVDAEIEAAGGDDGAQLARGHRRLDAGPHLARQRPVMQADRQVVGVLRPERLEEQLGLGAGVDEHQRGGGAADQLHHGRGCVAAPSGPPTAAAPGSRGSRCRAPARDRPAEPGHRPDTRRARRDPRRWRRGRPGAWPGPGPGPAQGRASADRRASIPQARGSRRRSPGRRRRTGVAPPRRRASAPAILALSAGFAAGPRAGGCALTPACRRCGPRHGSRGPSLRPGRAGCGGCRPRAPSGARRRACGGRGRGGGRVRSGWAGSLPASCRRPWARSAASQDRRRDRGAPAGGDAATSRAARTTRRTAEAGADPLAMSAAVTVGQGHRAGLGGSVTGFRVAQPGRRLNRIAPEGARSRRIELMAPARSPRRSLRERNG